MYGTTRPQSVRDAISKANSGKIPKHLADLNANQKWWTNGTIDILSKVCPPDFYRGRSKMKGKNNCVNSRWVT
jgi:hypothetical protein